MAISEMFSRLCRVKLSQCSYRYFEQGFQPTLSAVTSSETSNKVREEMVSTIGAIFAEGGEEGGCGAASAARDVEVVEKHLADGM